MVKEVKIKYNVKLCYYFRDNISNITPDNITLRHFPQVSLTSPTYHRSSLPIQLESALLESIAIHYSTRIRNFDEPDKQSLRPR